MSDAPMPDQPGSANDDGDLPVAISLEDPRRRSSGSSTRALIALAVLVVVGAGTFVAWRNGLFATRRAEVVVIETAPPVAVAEPVAPPAPPPPAVEPTPEPTPPAVEPAVAEAENDTDLEAEEDDSPAIDSVLRKQLKRVATRRFALAAPTTGSALEGRAAALMKAGADALKEGRFAVALEKYRAASRLHPENADALYGIALAQVELVKDKSAQKSLARALKLDGSHAEATLLSGYLAQLDKDLATARKLYQRYIELKPRGEYADEVRGILTNLDRPTSAPQPQPLPPPPPAPTTAAPTGAAPTTTAAPAAQAILPPPPG